jgi:hypothetical protein
VQKGRREEVKITTTTKIGWALALIVLAVSSCTIFTASQDVFARAERYCAKICTTKSNFTLEENDGEIYCVCHIKETKCNHVVSFSNQKEKAEDYCYNQVEAW